MLFNSFQFGLFFVVVTSLYFMIPHRWRWLLLLLASCFFYMAFMPIYILVLAFTITVDYVAGMWIEQATTGIKKYLLLASLLVNLGVLCVFKYFNFFAENMSGLATLVAGNPVTPFVLQIVLPIGLSFHTFQSMSYTIEVYRGKQQAERHIGILALYVLFYPQLVAGPIERPQNLLHQFYEHHDFEYQQVTDGLKLMTWGLFKKVVIADRLANLVNPIYASPQQYDGWLLGLGTIFFAYQIYCDFSGYSDIAIGAAQVMGFKLMQNFKRPYFSTSIAEFWSRWHISLSTWFRDYLYIPLGGNRVAPWRWCFNIMLVFLLSGLWHGANWTYIIWGALNGLYLIGEHGTQPIRLWLYNALRLDRVGVLIKPLQIITTFLLITFAWIFFRAQNLADALYIVTHLTTGYGQLLSPGGIGQGIAKLGNPIDITIVVIAIVCLEVVQAIQSRQSIRGLLAKQPVAIRWLAYYMLVMAILIFAQVANPIEFIYFRF